MDKKIEEMGLWDDEEVEEIKAKIYDTVLQNKAYPNQEVDEEMVMDLIEKHI